MEDEKFKVIGGSLEKSLNGQTKLDLKAIAQEAWDLSKKGKTEVMQGVMLLIFIVIVFAWVLQNVLGISEVSDITPRTKVAMGFIFTAISAPIMAAMLLLGMSQSVGLKPAFIPLLKRALSSLLVILLALLLSILVDISGQVLSLASLVFGYTAVLYLTMATGFSMMILIEKKLPPSQTIIQSFKVFNKHWAPLSIFYMGSLALLLLGMLSLGVAYIWLIPFYFNFKGVLYRELFGITVKNENDSTESSSQGVFNA